MAHTYNFEKMNKVLKEYLDKGRWYHTQGVRYMSVGISRRLNLRGFSTTARNASPTRKRSGCVRRTTSPSQR